MKLHNVGGWSRRGSGASFAVQMFNGGHIRINEGAMEFEEAQNYEENSQIPNTPQKDEKVQCPINISITVFKVILGKKTLYEKFFEILQWSPQISPSAP